MFARKSTAPVPISEKKGRAPLIWINAYPGTGKLAIGSVVHKKLGGDKVVFVDNHQKINPAEERQQRFHPDHQENRKLMRDYGFEQSHSFPEKIAIIIDFQPDDEIGRRVGLEFVDAARQQRRPFLPINLKCHQREVLRRMSLSERELGGFTKEEDVEIVKEYIFDWDLHLYKNRETFILDVTSLEVEESADKVIEYIHMKMAELEAS